MIPYSRRQTTTSDAGATERASEALDHELAAMRTVAQALDGLDTDHSRSRVLKWAAEFCRVKDLEPRAAPAPAQHSSIRTRETDSMLAVSGLESFFADDPRRSAAAGLIAIEEGLSLHDIDQAAVVHDMQEMRDVERNPQEAPEANATPVETMIQSLVADLKKLSADWETA
jgi:hypothetical protein